MYQFTEKELKDIKDIPLDIWRQAFIKGLQEAATIEEIGSSLANSLAVLVKKTELHKQAGDKPLDKPIVITAQQTDGMKY
jgi:hypothetical protein